MDRRYTAPTLTVYGKVSDLTQANPTSAAYGDGGTGTTIYSSVT